jgi:hypothetical protein
MKYVITNPRNQLFLWRYVAFSVFDIFLNSIQSILKSALVNIFKVSNWSKRKSVITNLKLRSKFLLFTLSYEYSVS